MTSKFDAVQPGKPQWYWHIGEAQEEVVQVIRDGSGTLWTNWGYGGSSKLPNGPRVLTLKEVEQSELGTEVERLKVKLREAIKNGAWLQGELTEAKGQLVVLKYGHTHKKDEP